MTTVERLLREAVSDPPDGALDAETLVGLGRGRVRRRRTTWIGVGIAAVVALVGAALVAGPIAPPHDDRPAGPLVRRIDPSTAEPARVGVDYRLLGQVTNRSLALADGHTLELQGSLTDGRQVVADHVDEGASGSGTTRRGLLDPTTGAVDWLPDRPAGRFLGQEDEDLVFGVAGVPGAALQPDDDHGYQVFDLGSRGWRSLPTNAAVDGAWLDVSLDQVVAGGYLYVADGADYRRTLWRVSLDTTGAGWTRVASVGAFAVDGTTLAWTDVIHGPFGHLTLRDLSTGAERELRVPGLDGCSPQGLAVGDSLVAMPMSCEAPGRPSELAVVLDRRGRVLATLEDHTVLRVQGDWVLLGSGGVNAPDGAQYAYRPRDGRLVLLSPFPSIGDLADPTPLKLWHERYVGSRRGPDAVAFDVVELP